MNGTASVRFWAQTFFWIWLQVSLQSNIFFKKINRQTQSRVLTSSLRQLIIIIFKYNSFSSLYLVKWKYNRHQSFTSLTNTLIKFTPRLNRHMNQFSSLSRGFEAKNGQKNFVVHGDRTRYLAFHIAVLCKQLFSLAFFWHDLRPGEVSV